MAAVVGASEVAVVPDDLSGLQPHHRRSCSKGSGLSLLLAVVLSWQLCRASGVAVVGMSSVACSRSLRLTSSSSDAAVVPDVLSGLLSYHRRSCSKGSGISLLLAVVADNSIVVHLTFVYCVVDADLA